MAGVRGLPERIWGKREPVYAVMQVLSTLKHNQEDGVFGLFSICFFQVGHFSFRVWKTQGAAAPCSTAGYGPVVILYVTGVGYLQF